MKTIAVCVSAHHERFANDTSALLTTQTRFVVSLVARGAKKYALARKFITKNNYKEPTKDALF